MQVVCNRKSRSGKMLADMLGASYGPIPRDRILVPWGRIVRGDGVIGNYHITRNKLRQLEKMKDGGLSVPIFGRGEPGVFPCFLRKVKHTRGRDIIYIENRMEYDKKMHEGIRYDFWSGFIRKKAEYRTYFVHNAVVSIAEKTPDLSRLKFPRARWVWNHGTGFVFKIFIDNGLKEDLKKITIKGARVLGFDYGAADIILGEDDKLYILEYNSAPGLIPRRAEIFARHIRRLAYCNIVENGSEACFRINTREIPEVF